MLAAVLHVLINVVFVLSANGGSLTGLRTYAKFDQIGYLAIVTNVSHGQSPFLEPLTLSGASHYPSGYYILLGWLTGAVGTHPVLTWNVVGMIVQASLVAGVATASILLFRRWWIGLLAPLPFVTGVFAWIREGQGGWRIDLESHAVLWGPFPTLFVGSSTFRVTRS